MKYYAVKTRNWYQKKWVKKILDLSLLLGVSRGDSYTDGDAKYGIRTQNLVIAWGVWAYFQMLKPFSGGWTYIVRPGSEIGCVTYKNIY